jgi:CBS domain-containing protein
MVRRQRAQTVTVTLDLKRAVESRAKVFQTILNKARPSSNVASETSAEFASSLQHSEAPPSSRRSKCGLVSKMARSCNCSSVTPAFLPTAELISELELVMALPVEQLMTSEVETCSPEDAIVEFMEVMTLQRIRHLPVVRNAALEGIVSIGDVVRQRLQRSPVRAEGATQLPLLVLEGTASDLR